MEVNPDFKELLALFAKHRVEYVIVGGYAVGHHGAPRYTGDIDLYTRPTPQNAARIIVALDAFGFGDTGLTSDDFEIPGKVIQMGVPPNRIDLLTSIDGVDWDEASRSPSMGQYGDLAVPYISREALLRNKRATGRTKDLADAEAIEPIDDK